LRGDWKSRASPMGQQALGSGIMSRSFRALSRLRMLARLEEFIRLFIKENIIILKVLLDTRRIMFYLL